MRKTNFWWHRLERLLFSWYPFLYVQYHKWENDEYCMKLKILTLGYITQHSLLFFHIFTVADNSVFFHEIVLRKVVADRQYEKKITVCLLNVCHQNNSKCHLYVSIMTGGTWESRGVWSVRFHARDIYSVTFGMWLCRVSLYHCIDILEANKGSVSSNLVGMALELLTEVLSSYCFIYLFFLLCLDMQHMFKVFWGVVMQ